MIKHDGITVLRTNLLPQANDSANADVKAKYRAFPVSIKFLMNKIYEPAGIPIYLVFDEKGKLILRRRSNTEERTLRAIEDVLSVKS